MFNKFKNLEDYFHLPVSTPNSKPSWFGFPLTLKENTGFKRVDLLKFLDSNRIGTRLLFAGNLIKQPYFKNVEYRIVGELTNTEKTMDSTFWLGLFPALDKKHLDYIYEKFEEFLGLNF